MYDNDVNDGNNIEEPLYDGNNIEEPLYDAKMPIILLKDIIIDFEEQLYNVKVQIIKHSSNLREKEKELSEKERIKVHNLDLFSPIYSEVYKTKDIDKVIEQLSKKIKELTSEQEILSNKIKGVKNAIQLLESNSNELIKKETDKLNENIQNLNDKGLSILEAQEFERQRIARDLHDSTVQNLTSLVHKSELCIKLIDIDTIRAKLELTVMSHTIKMVINEMRDVIYNLKPMTLEDLGLTITIERYANHMMELYNIHVVVNSNIETKEILTVIKLTLFRIIQEACVNVVKHANATLITIDINYENQNITVSIKDNGKGFNIDEILNKVPEHSSSFGLSIMKERISLLSGTLKIQSEKGMGTVVIVSAPLTIYEGVNDEQAN